MRFNRTRDRAMAVLTLALLIVTFTPNAQASETVGQIIDEELARLGGS